MTTTYYDIETDGLLDACTTVHCLVTCTDGRIQRWHDQPEVAPRDGDLAAGLAHLAAADLRCGHNVLGFDEPALDKLRPGWARPRSAQGPPKAHPGAAHGRLPGAPPRDARPGRSQDPPQPRSFDHGAPRGLPGAAVLDTQVLAQAAFPRGALRAWDTKVAGVRPGSHSLESWGTRLGIAKLSDLVQDRWDTFTADMLAYCVRDVEIVVALHEHVLRSGHLPQRAAELEHRFAAALRRQEWAGFAVDEERLARLVDALLNRRAELDEALVRLFPPVVRTRYTPVRQERRDEEIAFNPQSRHHIGERMVAAGWAPLAWTDGGLPRCEEADLRDMVAQGLPGAAELAEHFVVSKRLGQIRTGPQNWLSHLDRPTTVGPHGPLPGPRRLHGRIVHNAAVTHRCAHSSPNLAQVPGPAADPIWGARCRAVFVARPGHALVGVDAANLELRGLAHYLHPLDGGAYTQGVLDGDPHAAGMAATGMTERSVYKARFYALIYGAGDAKLGAIAGESAAQGAAFRRRLMSGITGFDRLVDRVRAAAARGWLKALDGRRTHVRAPSAALNTLLQSFGALVMKLATVNVHALLDGAGIVHGRDWWQVAHCHDEIQLEVREEMATEAAAISVVAFRDVATTFLLRCPLDADAKIGRDWSETH